MDTIYQIDLPYACGGLLCENDIVIKAPPIFKWMIGKNIKYIESWVKSKNGQLIKAKQ